MKIEITPIEAIELLTGLNEWLDYIDKKHKNIDARNLTNEKSRKLFKDALENLGNIKDF